MKVKKLVAAGVSSSRQQLPWEQQHLQMVAA